MEKVLQSDSWLLPLTEEELVGWISCPRFKLPRCGVAAQSFNLLDQVAIADVSDDKDDWLLAVYEARGVAPRDGVPFSNVRCLIALSERKLALLENHHGENVPEIKLATLELRTSFDGWWMKARIETLAMDCENGANSLAELLGVRRRVRRTYGRKVAEILVDEEIGRSRSDLPFKLFEYSRSEEVDLPPLGAAFCDLGHILRCCTDDAQGNMVSILAHRVGEMFNLGKEVSPEDIKKLMIDLTGWLIDGPCRL